MHTRTIVVTAFLFACFSVCFGITVWVSWEGEDWYHEVATEYTRKTGVPIEIVQLPSLEPKLQVAVKTKDTLPDLCLIKSDYLPVVQPFALPVYSQDIPDYFPRFVPIGVDTYTTENTLYAIPFYADVQVMYLQKEVFSKSGVELPDTNWTIDDMETLMKTFSEKGQLAIGWGFNSPYIFQGLQESFGSSFMPDGHINILTDSNRTLLRRLRTWVVNGWFKDYPQRPGLVKDFSAGKVAMIPQGSFLIPSFDESGLPYAVTTLPFPWKSVIDTKAWVIFSHPDEVYPFIIYMIERMNELCDAFVKQSLITGVASELPYASVLETAMQCSMVQPSTQAYASGYWTAMKACLELYLRGQGELEPLLSTAQEYIDRYQ
jgi:ABC-type glycerol-3-phosphate transport system substrate-binding protein